MSSMTQPLSSAASRLSASARVSPACTRPPGSSQPALRVRTSSTRRAGSRVTALTPTVNIASLRECERDAEQAGDHADDPEPLGDLHLAPAHQLEVAGEGGPPQQPLARAHAKIADLQD